jgi:phosphoglycerol transferase
LTEDFVARLFTISPPEDTLVVLVSDHLAHKMVSATPQLSKLERHNTAIFLGAGVAPGRVGTPGSMLDIYPTILESLGYGLQGHQAGMGISLLQPSRETLVGQLGTAEIDRRLARDSDLSAIVWQGPDALATK